MRECFRLLSRLSCATVLAATLAACGPSVAEEAAAAPEAEPAALTVTVEPVRREAMATVVTATGTVEAWQELTVSSEASGIALVEVLAEEGDQVAKGALLARLDDRMLTAEIAQQRAKIAEAEATLAKSIAENERGAQLLAKSAMSKEEAEERGTTERTSRAQLDQEKAALEMLQVELGRTRIVAPVAGIVIDKPTVLGTIVQTGTELFRLVRDGRLEIAAKVPEQRLAGVREGQAVTVTDAAGRISTGTVRAIAGRVDDTTRLGAVYVALPADTTLKIGMFARVSIAVEASVALTVPQSALTWRAGTPAVFVLGASDVVTLRPVVAGSRRDGRVAVTDGVAEGERIAVDGVGFLNDGDRVRVAAARPSDETAAAGAAVRTGTGAAETPR